MAQQPLYSHERISRTIYRRDKLEVPLFQFSGLTRELIISCENRLCEVKKTFVHACSVHCQEMSTPLTQFTLADENGEKRPKGGDGEAGEAEEKIPYPKSIFFILSMEACERFSYYGMRSESFFGHALHGLGVKYLSSSGVVALPEVPLYGQWNA